MDSSDGVPAWIDPGGSSGLVVVLTALDLEHEAVRRHMSGVEVHTHPSGTLFEIGLLTGTRWRIALAVVGPGNHGAAIVTDQAIAIFRPAALIFVGIAGALHDNLRLGDVVVGARIYAYHGGREDPDGFKARPRSWEAPNHLLHLARFVARTTGWVDLLPESVQANPPAVHIAAIAAGEVVINSLTSALVEQIRLHYNDAAAVEMESAGFAHASHLNRSTPAITIRGISDAAGGEKQHSDRAGWRETAAVNAGAFALALVRHMPPSHTDPVKAAQELALTRAVRQYATSDGNLAVAAPLFDPNGFLSDKEILAQLAEGMLSAGHVDAEMIGSRWRAALTNPPSDRDFTEDATILVGYFREQASYLPPLRSVQQAQVLVHLDHELAAARGEILILTGLVATGIGYGVAPRGVRNHLYDQTALLAEKTRGFVGRRFVFTRITRILDEADRGYCSVVALPGIGKTALLSQLVKSEGYVNHFNVRTGGVTSPAAFLRNVCAQLITRYQLPVAALPAQAGQDSTFLVELLGQAVAGSNGHRIVIAVDALDEADDSQLLPGTNPMYLPEFLPERCFILLTTRSGDPDHPEQAPRLRTSCEQFVVPIGARSEDNMADIREYIGQRSSWPGIQDYQHRHGLDDNGFVEHVAAKSDGNFMYLHHVLPEIERGAMTDRDLASIPTGLEQYYADQLERMRGSDEATWYDYRLPVIGALSLLREPLTVEQIAGLTGIASAARIHDALRSWAQFLRHSTVVERGRSRRAYSIYHASYQDFLLQYTSEVEAALIERMTERLTEDGDDEDGDDNE